MVVANPPTVELVFDRRVRVAGETIEGEVQLYFPSVVANNLSEVIIRLSGGITTTVSQFNKEGTYVRRHVDLAHEEHVLWKAGDAYPKAGSHILRLPFRFKLPDNLPPSCDFPCFAGGRQARGTVSYFVEVTGTRLGLRRDLKISRAFPIVPWNVAGATSHAHLVVYGWSGRWKTLRETKDMRRGFLGERSRVDVSVRVPDISGLPVDTPVPFVINVMTITKPMQKTDLKLDESIWPAPPTRAEDLEFTLERTCSILTENGVNPVFDHLFVTYLGGLGPKGKAKHDGEVVIERKEPVWLPFSEQKNSKSIMGQWRQEVTFSSFFNLSYIPPAFETKSFSLQYNGHLKMSFPGVGNKLEFDIPIKVVSCVPSPESRVPWDAPPPQLDLPPSYFELEGWHVEEREINLLSY